MSDKQYTEVLQKIERLKSSGMGNPKWRFHFPHGEVRDSVANAGFAYAVDTSWEGKSVTYDVNKNGDVTNMKVAGMGERLDHPGSVPWTHKSFGKGH